MPARRTRVSPDALSSLTRHSTIRGSVRRCVSSASYYTTRQLSTRAMDASLEATAPPVSSYFGKPAPLASLDSAAMSEPPTGSFEACESVVDDLVGDDDPGHLAGAFAKLGEDHRCPSTVEETTGRGYFSPGHTLPSEEVRDVQDVRNFREAWAFAPSWDRSRLAQYTRAPEHTSKDEQRLANASTATPFFPSASVGVQKMPPTEARSAPPSPFVSRRASADSISVGATPMDSPSPISPLDWSRTPKSIPHAAAAPVAGGASGASRAFAACTSSGAPVPGGHAPGTRSPLSSPSESSGAGLGLGGSMCTDMYNYLPMRRAHSLDFNRSPEQRHQQQQSSPMSFAGYEQVSDSRGDYSPYAQRTATTCPPCDNAHEQLPYDMYESLDDQYDRYDDRYDSYDDQDSEHSRAEYYYSQNSLYKTELCRSWEETGACRYGGKCQFAHTRGELRPVMRHPKYKTETCRTFLQSGHCPYGTRCRFIHYRVPHRNLANGTLVAQAHDVILEDWRSNESFHRTGGSPMGRRVAEQPNSVPSNGFARVHPGVGVGSAPPTSPQAHHVREIPAVDQSSRSSRLPVFANMREAGVDLIPSRKALFKDSKRAEDDSQDVLEDVARDVARRAVDVTDDDEGAFQFALTAERRASAAAAAAAVRGGHDAQACVM